MAQLLWLALTWVAGTAAILGSLMTLGSFILWVSPVQSRSAQSRSRKPPQSFTTLSSWQSRLRLLAVSLAIALGGLGILFWIPFPSP